MREVIGTLRRIPLVAMLPQACMPQSLMAQPFFVFLLNSSAACGASPPCPSISSTLVQLAEAHQPQGLQGLPCLRD
jgi:hypothetical protein